MMILSSEANVPAVDSIGFTATPGRGKPGKRKSRGARLATWNLQVKRHVDAEHPARARVEQQKHMRNPATAELKGAGFGAAEIRLSQKIAVTDRETDPGSRVVQLVDSSVLRTYTYPVFHPQKSQSVSAPRTGVGMVIIASWGQWAPDEQSGDDEREQFVPKLHGSKTIAE